MPLPLSLFAEGVSWKYLNLADDISLIEMLSNIDYFKSRPVNIPKITIWLDNGYHPKKHIGVKKIYPGVLIKFDWNYHQNNHSGRKNRKEKQDLFPSKQGGLLRELTLGWEDVRAWPKTLKELTENADAKINFCFIRLTLKRLELSKDGGGSYIP